MPRKLKAHEVKLYKHPSGIEVAIKLDRETMAFRATVAEGVEFQWRQSTRRLTCSRRASAPSSLQRQDSNAFRAPGPQPRSF